MSLIIFDLADWWKPRCVQNLVPTSWENSILSLKVVSMLRTSSLHWFGTGTLAVITLFCWSSHPLSFFQEIILTADYFVTDLSSLYLSGSCWGLLWINSSKLKKYNGYLVGSFYNYICEVYRRYFPWICSDWVFHNPILSL